MKIERIILSNALHAGPVRKWVVLDLMTLIGVLAFAAITIKLGVLEYQIHNLGSVTQKEGVNDE